MTLVLGSALEPLRCSQATPPGRSGGDHTDAAAAERIG